MAESKELWPVAGVGLNVPNITEADLTAVDRRLDELADTLARITFLKKLQIEFLDAARIHHSVLFLARKEGKTEIDPKTESDQERVFRKRRDWLLDQVTHRLTRLKYIREIEREEEDERARRATKAMGADEGVEADPVSGQWLNEQIAIALYALLRAAGLPDKHNKTAVARFAHLLTGRSQIKMKKAGYEATGMTFSDDGAKAVIEEFERMGLAKLAAAVRDKDFTKL